MKKISLLIALFFVVSCGGLETFRNTINEQQNQPGPRPQPIRNPDPKSSALLNGKPANMPQNVYDAIKVHGGEANHIGAKNAVLQPIADALSKDEALRNTAIKNAIAPHRVLRGLDALIITLLGSTEGNPNPVAIEIINAIKTRDEANALKTFEKALADGEKISEFYPHFLLLSVTHNVRTVADKLVSELGVDVNVWAKLNLDQAAQSFALLEAALANEGAMVEFLVSKGAAIEQKLATNTTFRIIFKKLDIEWDKYIGMAMRLLDLGAKSDGAAMELYEKGVVGKAKEDLFKKVIKTADLNQKNINGDTLLLLGAKTANFELLFELFEVISGLSVQERGPLLNYNNGKLAGELLCQMRKPIKRHQGLEKMFADIGAKCVLDHHPGSGATNVVLPSTCKGEFANGFTKWNSGNNLALRINEVNANKTDHDLVDAVLAEINRAYKFMCLRDNVHPDRGGNEGIFKKVSGCVDDLRESFQKLKN